jgi:hypothetical protein
MFDQAPANTVLAVRVRKEMERDIRREARKRRLKVSEEVRRRLQFYEQQHAEKPKIATAE